MSGMTVARVTVWAGIVVFFVAPLLFIVSRGAQQMEWSSVQDVPSILAATLLQAVWSTSVAVCIAIPIAWALTVEPGRLSTWVMLWVSIPFIIPTPVAAVLLQSVCGPTTWCGALFGIEVAQGFVFVVLVQAWYNIGLIVRVVTPAWAAIRGTYGAVAATLGAPSWRQLTSITIPLLTPSILNGALLVLLYCIGSFGVIVLLGGGRMVSIEVEIWRQTSQYLRIDRATVLTVVQLLMSMVVLRAVDSFGLARPIALPVYRTPRQSGWIRWLAYGVICVALLVFVLPYGSLALRAFDGTDPFAALRAMQSPVRGSGMSISPLLSLARSFWIATCVAGISMVIGWIATTPGTRLRNAVVLPLGVSTITLGLGYLLWFGTLGWLKSPWLLIAVHCVIVLPIVTRQLLVGRDRLPTQYAAASQTLGAAPLRRLRQIELPLLRRTLGAAASLAYALSLGDYAAAFVLSRPDSATAPVIIARLLNRPGATNYAQAAALSLVFVVCCVLVMVVVQRAASDRDD
jgi:thiamine transport system permease protein